MKKDVLDSLKESLEIDEASKIGRLLFLLTTVISGRKNILLEQIRKD